MKLTLIAIMLVQTGLLLPRDQDKKEQPAKQGVLPPGWKMESSPEGGFSVALPPGQVITLDEKQPFKGLGEQAIKGVAGFTDSKTVFTAFSFALPKELQKKNATEQLEALGNAFKQELGGGKPKRETKVTVGEVAGLQIEAGDKQGTGIVRVFVARERVFVLMAGGPKLSDSSLEVQAFFGSFKLKAAPGQALPESVYDFQTASMGGK
jgi:hypothetical protein